jgi:hypothetical protein
MGTTFFGDHDIMKYYVTNKDSTLFIHIPMGGVAVSSAYLEDADMFLNDFGLARFVADAINKQFSEEWIVQWLPDGQSHKAKLTGNE